MIQRQDIINFFQYFCVVGTLLFSFLSLFINQRRKKIVFFSLTLLFSSALGVLLYSGVIFFISVIPILIVLLFVFVFQSEGDKEDGVASKVEAQTPKNLWSQHLLRVVLGAVLCITVGYLFYAGAFGFFVKYEKADTISIATTSSVISELYTNYLPGVVIVILALFSSILWIIQFLDISKKKGIRGK